MTLARQQTPEKGGRVSQPASLLPSVLQLSSTPAAFLFQSFSSFSTRESPSVILLFSLTHQRWKTAVLCSADNAVKTFLSSFLFFLLCGHLFGPKQKSCLKKVNSQPVTSISAPLLESRLLLFSVFCRGFIFFTRM